MTSAVEFQAFEKKQRVVEYDKNTKTCMNYFDFTGEQ